MCLAGFTECSEYRYTLLTHQTHVPQLSHIKFPACATAFIIRILTLVAQWTFWCWFPWWPLASGVVTSYQAVRFSLHVVVSAPVALDWANRIHKMITLDFWHNTQSDGRWDLGKVTWRWTGYLVRILCLAGEGTTMKGPRRCLRGRSICLLSYRQIISVAAYKSYIYGCWEYDRARDKHHWLNWYGWKFMKSCPGATQWDSSLYTWSEIL